MSKAQDQSGKLVLLKFDLIGGWLPINRTMVIARAKSADVVSKEFSVSIKLFQGCPSVAFLQTFANRLMKIANGLFVNLAWNTKKIKVILKFIYFCSDGRTSNSNQLILGTPGIISNQQSADKVSLSNQQRCQNPSCVRCKTVSVVTRKLCC